MIPMILLGMTLVGLLCVLAYRLATYALPFMFGLAAARFAYATGSGLIGAGVVGFVAGAVAFGLLRLMFSRLRVPILRGLVALIFVFPAAIAGYQLVNGVCHPKFGGKSSAAWVGLSSGCRRWRGWLHLPTSEPGKPIYLTSFCETAPQLLCCVSPILALVVIFLARFGPSLQDAILLLRRERPNVFVCLPISILLN